MATVLRQYGDEVQSILDAVESKADKQYVDEGLAEKQDTLVSGENIKTIGGQSILGQGNIDPAGGFVAEYGVTRYEEIMSAHRSGRTVFVNASGKMYVENNYATNRIFFIGGYADGQIRVASLTASNQWSTADVPYMPKSGGRFSGPVIFEDRASFEAPLYLDEVPIYGVADPVSGTDAANRQYVDSGLATKASASDVSDINAKIPAQASAQNQLADKNFVNSSIQTNTATFRGTYGNLPYFAAWSLLEYGTPDNNDYATVRDVETSAWDADNPYQADEVCLYDDGSHTKIYLCIKDMGTNPRSVTPDEDTEYWKAWMTTEFLGSFVGTWFFKYIPNGAFDITNWKPEFQINEKPLTAEQLAALNSGIVSNDVTKLRALPTKPVDTQAQVLSDAQKAQARENIGARKDDVAIELSDSDDGVHFAPEDSQILISVYASNKVQETYLIVGDAEGWDVSNTQVTRISGGSDNPLVSFYYAQAFAQGGKFLIRSNIDDEVIELRFIGLRPLPVLSQYTGELPPGSEEIEPEDIGSSPDAVLYTPQALTDAQKLQARTNIGATATEVFWATYGTTTYAEITDAISAGKAVMLLYNSNRQFTLAGLHGGSYMFTETSGSTIYTIECSTQSAWTHKGVAWEKTSYKKSSWSTTPNDTNYPSEKLTYDSIQAVYDFVKALADANGLTMP